MPSRRKKRRMEHGKGKIEKGDKTARGSLVVGHRRRYDPGKNPYPRAAVVGETHAYIAIETRQLRRARERAERERAERDARS